MVFLWDALKLDRGEWDLLDIEVTDLLRLEDRDVRSLDGLALPHISLPEAGLDDVQISAALRWAKRTLQPQIEAEEARVAREEANVQGGRRRSEQHGTFGTVARTR